MAQTTTLRPYGFPGPVPSFVAKTAAASYVSHGRLFLFEDKAWWNGEFVLEANIRAIAGTTSVRLWNDTDSVAVTDSVITNSTSTLTRTRSSGIKLIHGKVYRVQLKTDAVNQGRALGADLVYVREGRLRTAVQDPDETRRSLANADLGERRFSFFALAEELVL